MSIAQIIGIAIGGALGTLLRFFISQSINQWFIKVQWVTPSIVVNILGCLILGILIESRNKNLIESNNLFLSATIGFCGGLTTFSTFIAEIVVLNQKLSSFIFNIFIFTPIVISLSLGVLAFVMGRWIIKIIV